MSTREPMSEVDRSHLAAAGEIRAICIAALDEVDWSKLTNSELKKVFAHLHEVLQGGEALKEPRP